MFLHICPSNTFEVHFVLLHLDGGVLHIGQADIEDDVLRSLSPGAAGRGQLFIRHVCDVSPLTEL